MSHPENNLDWDCDVRFGLNLDPRDKGAVGYLLSFSGCGGIGLRKDIEVWNPYDAAGQTVVTGPNGQCVGLLESFRFRGGGDDPMRFVAYVSKGTAADIRAKLARPLPSTKARLSFYIIAFDDEKKQWFEAVLPKDRRELDVNLDTTGGALQIFVSGEPKRPTEAFDLNVYRFEFQVVPALGASALLEFSTGPTQHLVKQWGAHR